jgi:hypothetical protein
MAICNIIHDPEQTQEQYEQISSHVRNSGPVLPEGCRVAVLGRGQAITVWDTSVQRDRFLAERLRPAYAAVGRSLEKVRRSQFDVDMLVAGDLASVTQLPVGVDA